MTDRIRTLTVILEQDFRDDDVEVIVNAIRMIRHVDSVELGEPVNMNDYLAREIAASKLRQELMDVLFPKKKT